MNFCLEVIKNQTNFTHTLSLFFGMFPWVYSANGAKWWQLEIFTKKTTPVAVLFEKKSNSFKFHPPRGKPGKKDVFFFRTVSEAFFSPHFPTFFGAGVKGPGLAPVRQPGLVACELYAQGTDGTIAIHCGGQSSGLWRMGSQDGDGYVVRIRAPPFMVAIKGKGHEWKGS